MPEGRHNKQGPMRNPSIHGGRSEINNRTDQVARQNSNGRTDFQQPRNDGQARNEFHVQPRNENHSAPPTTPAGMGLGINAEQIRDLEADLATNERTFISGLFQAEEGEGVKEKRWI